MNRTNVTYYSNATERLSNKIREEKARSDRRNHGQFFTPRELAYHMASMIDLPEQAGTVLEPCAGTGMLISALIDTNKAAIHFDGFEIDQDLAEHASSALRPLNHSSHTISIHFTDFISHYVAQRENIDNKYDAVILNPPYKKINSKDKNWESLRVNGINHYNFYSAFLDIALNAAKPKGCIVALVPRSFCSGYHFKKFRQNIAKSYQIESIHILNSREKVFREDSVLQENIILKIKKEFPPSNHKVQISQCDGDLSTNFKSINILQTDLVSVLDPELYFRLITCKSDISTIREVSRFQNSIINHGFIVSTGKIVDFRLPLGAVTTQKDKNSFPLLYPGNLHNWDVQWPSVTPKGSLMVHATRVSAHQLLNDDYAVLVKRFTSKEEKRRVVASFFSKKELGPVAVENHINTIVHSTLKSAKLMYGLSAYLNSDLVNNYYKIISGHTQINANDLKNLPCPDITTLKKIGDWVQKHKLNLTPLGAYEAYHQQSNLIFKQ